MRRIAGCLLACSLAISCAPSEEDRGWVELIDAARQAHAGGHTDEAIELGLQALEAAERGSQDQQLLVSLSELASFHEKRGETAEAVVYRRRALDLRELSSGADNLGLAGGYTELAGQYQELGDLPQAAFCLRRAMELRRQGLGPDDLGAARIASDLGVVLMASDPEEAQTVLEQAIATLERGLPATHPDLAVPMTNYGQLMRQLGEPAVAEAWLRRAMEIYRANAPNSARLAVSMDNLADVLQTQGDVDEAEQLLKDSIEILEEKLGTNDPQLATSLNNLALLYRRQSRFAEAESIYRRAATHLERTVGPAHPDLAATIFNLARLYDARQQPGAAEPLFLRSLDMYERTLGPDHTATGLVLKGYARMLDKTGRSEEAAVLEQRAERILGGS